MTSPAVVHPDELEPRAKRLLAGDVDQDTISVFVPHTEHRVGGDSISCTIDTDPDTGEIVHVHFSPTWRRQMAELGYPDADAGVESFLEWTARIAYRRRNR